MNLAQGGPVNGGGLARAVASVIWTYDVVPLFFLPGTVIGVTAIVWGEIEAGNYSPIVGLCIAAAGFPVHHVWKRFRTESTI